MRRIDMVFEDKEFNRIVKVKNITGMNWHDFILWLVDNNSKVVKK